MEMGTTETQRHRERENQILCAPPRLSAVSFFTAEFAENAQRYAEKNILSVSLCLCGYLLVPVT
jgi:hypothetical protein